MCNALQLSSISFVQSRIFFILFFDDLRGLAGDGGQDIEDHSDELGGEADAQHGQRHPVVVVDQTRTRLIYTVHDLHFIDLVKACDTCYYRNKN